MYETFILIDFLTIEDIVIKGSLHKAVSLIEMLQLIVSGVACSSVQIHAL